MTCMFLLLEVRRQICSHAKFSRANLNFIKFTSCVVRVFTYLRKWESNLQLSFFTSQIGARFSCPIEWASLPDMQTTPAAMVFPSRRGCCIFGENQLFSTLRLYLDSTDVQMFGRITRAGKRTIATSLSRESFDCALCPFPPGQHIHRHIQAGGDQNGGNQDKIHGGKLHLIPEEV